MWGKRKPKPLNMTGLKKLEEKYSSARSQYQAKSTHQKDPSFDEYGKNEKLKYITKLHTKRLSPCDQQFLTFRSNKND
jgi:hypothetical protein